MRSRGIGASEVAAVCHLDPWTTARELWEYKTKRRKKPPPSPAMAFGIEMEPVAFEYYCQLTGFKGETQVRAVHDTIPFLRAIADGWDGTTGVQIKVPSGEHLLRALRRGDIPKNYLLQCYAEMEIFGASNWTLFVYDADEPEASSLIGIDGQSLWNSGYVIKDFWEHQAVGLLKDFWGAFERDEWEDAKIPEPDEMVWKAALHMREESKVREQEAEDLKAESDAILLQEMRFNSKLSCAGHRAFWQKRKASYGVSIGCEDEETMRKVFDAIKDLENAEGVKEVKARVTEESYSFQVKEVKEK